MHPVHLEPTSPSTLLLEDRLRSLNQFRPSLYVQFVFCKPVKPSHQKQHPHDALHLYGARQQVSFGLLLNYQERYTQSKTFNGPSMWPLILQSLECTAWPFQNQGHAELAGKQLSSGLYKASYWAFCIPLLLNLVGHYFNWTSKTNFTGGSLHGATTGICCSGGV